MKKFKIKKLLLIGGSIILIAIVTSLLLFTKKDKEEPYFMEITIETTDSLDTKNAYYIELTNDTHTTKAKTSYLKSDIYMIDDKIIYQENGRFKKVLSDYSYRDILGIINEFKNDLDDGVYHPKISSQKLNELFQSLFINYTIDREANTNISIKNKDINYFSIYLENILEFKNLNIIISFKELKDYYIETPIFYDEVTDEVDKKILTPFQKNMN